MPLQIAQANILSSLFGNSALADNTSTVPSSTDNSQTIALLQANVSSASVLKDTSSSSGTDNTVTTEDDASPSANVSNNALVPSTGPMGVSDGTTPDDSTGDQTSVYVVRQGDTVAGIAKLFGVTVNTVLAANDLTKGAKLTEGQVLLILPISGVEHTVTKGETLKSIAAHYKVDETDIAVYNGISEDTVLSVGDQLLIPGGDDMSDEGGGTPSPSLGSSLSKDEQYYANNPNIPDITNYFIDPVPTGHKTQGLHGPGHRGIDIGVPVGTPIMAAASGTISLAHTGWSGGYGNMVIINHPNGTKTLYAHMSKIIAHVGDQVTQGDIIGLSGGAPGAPGAGNSTGPHVHFEVFNAQNPGVDWSWKPWSQ